MRNEFHSCIAMWLIVCCLDPDKLWLNHLEAIKDALFVFSSVTLVTTFSDKILSEIWGYKMFLLDYF